MRGIQHPGCCGPSNVNISGPAPSSSVPAVRHSGRSGKPVTSSLKPDVKLVILKQQQTKLLQTVNHARVLWDPTVKPKGIFGWHINVRSIISKTEQIEKSDSNLDYLGLSETWLTPTLPSGYQAVKLLSNWTKTQRNWKFNQITRAHIKVS